MRSVHVRVSDDISAEFDRICLEQGLNCVDCFSALVLRARKRSSGLRAGVWDETAFLSRLGNYVADGLAEVKRGAYDAAVNSLQGAQRFLAERVAERGDVIRDTTAARIRARGGSDNWEQAERKRLQ